MSLVRDPSQRLMPASVDEPVAGDTELLAGALRAHRRVFVLTGAGCSTASGIPDYRDTEGQWKRQRPVLFQAFMGDPLTRARYWARSLVGWRSFGRSSPNDAHLALAALEHSGRTGLLVTQNVDGLHQAAGSRRVIDLHGRLDRVLCVSCRHRSPRSAWQHLLEQRNAGWAGIEAPVAPDGDADLDDVDFSSFDVPGCSHCAGIVKPDVVFFGEGVPVWRHAQAAAALADSQALLIAGSSLMVYSGYRYAVAAARQSKPVYAVNLGRTRADHLLTLKVSAPTGPTLSDVTTLLSS